MTLGQQHRRHLPQLRRPVRPDRPRVHGLRQVDATPRRSPRSSARTPSFPDADLAITGPGEESGTYDCFVELALDADRQDARPDRRGSRHTTTRPDYTASANDNAIIEGVTGSADLAGLGRLRLRRGEPRQGQARSRSPRRPTAPASRRAPRPSPTAATRSRGRCTSTSTRPRPPRTRRSPPTSTTTWPTARSRTVLETVPYVNLPADDARRDRARPGPPPSSLPPPPRDRAGPLGGPARSSILRPRPDAPGRMQPSHDPAPRPAPPARRSLGGSAAPAAPRARSSAACSWRCALVTIVISVFIVLTRAGRGDRVPARRSTCRSWSASAGSRAAACSTSRRC